MNNTDCREKLLAKNWDSFSVKASTFKYRQRDFTHEEIKNSLTELIWDRIHNFFTIARKDAGATQLDVNEINNFILNHMDQITELVCTVMEEEEDNSEDGFQELYVAEPSYIKEILLEDVDFITASDEYKPIVDSLEQQGGRRKKEVVTPKTNRKNGKRTNLAKQRGNGEAVGYYPAVGQERIGGMVEYTSRPIFVGELSQLDGYNKITNPITGRKVNINTKLGKKILYNYFKNIKT